MSQISTGIGLVSGLDIESIVTQLMQFEARPVANLATRIETMNTEKTAFAQLTAYLLELKMMSDNLFGDSNVFTSRLANSSNSSVLDASAAASTPIGNYAFTVKSLVQSHQIVSRGFSGTDSTPGATTMTIEMGAGSARGATSLDSLNGGAGVAAGSIRVTDRSGLSATVDLSGAITVQNVLDEINSAENISVRASVDGDRIVLTDTTGSTAYDLSVVQVGSATTAADLGLLASVAADVLTGGDIVSVSALTSLDSLNDSRGVRHSYSLPDFRITRRDGTTLDVNISAAEDLGDVMDLINNHADNADGLLEVSVSADGTRLVLTDSTGGPADLVVSGLNGSNAATDLGILGNVAGDTLTGSRIIAALNTVLLTSLNGGSGVPGGSIDITDMTGASATIDLSGAETLSDVLGAINAAALGVTASLNSAGTGLVLTDTSGGSGTLSVAEVDSTAAEALGILGSADSDVLRGGNLQLQSVSERTLFEDLNGGEGVFKGRFRITDRNGASAVVDLSQADDNRVEDVISEINSRGIGIVASINANGDGLLITDTTGGSGELKVVDLDGGTTAGDLNIAGTATEAAPTYIDGSFEYVIDIEATDTLEDIAEKIENSGAPVSAMILNDGSATNPYRLGLVSSVAGSVGEIVVDTGAVDFGFVTTQEARDAVLLYGQALPGSTPIVVTSTSNRVSGLVEGLTLNLTGVSDVPVTVSVTSDDEAVVARVQNFVDTWNEGMDFIQMATGWDPDAGTRGLLLGDFTVQRVEQMLQQMISYIAPAATPGMNRLSRVGVSFMPTGNISFSQSKLREALATGRSDVERLFTGAETGLGAHFSEVLENITDEYSGLLKRKSDLLNDQIEVLQTRKESLEERLVKVQARLYSEFYAMEEALSMLEAQRTAIENLPNLLAYSPSRND